MTKAAADPATSAVAVRPSAVSVASLTAEPSSPDADRLLLAQVIGLQELNASDGT